MAEQTNVKDYPDIQTMTVDDHMALGKRIHFLKLQLDHYIHEMHAKKCKKSPRAKWGFIPLFSRDKKFYNRIIFRNQRLHHLKHSEFIGHLNCWFEELMFYYDRFQRKTPTDIYYSNTERFGTYEKNSFTFENLSSAKTLTNEDKKCIMSTIDDVLELYDFLVSALLRCLEGMNRRERSQKDHWFHVLSVTMKEKRRVWLLLKEFKWSPSAICWSDSNTHNKSSYSVVQIKYTKTRKVWLIKKGGRLHQTVTLHSIVNRTKNNIYITHHW